MHRAAAEGIAVAKPYGVIHPYDCLIQYKRRLLRIQVKSTYSQALPRNPGAYRVRISRRVAGKFCWYTREEVDFVVAFLGARDIWYIIPIEKIGTRRWIYFYPDGSKMPFAGLFEEFREAWHLLKGEPQPADIPAIYAEASAFCAELLDPEVKELRPISTSGGG
jgi:hypothetical protein